MNIQQLQWAMEVYHIGSFTKAARRLYQAQPNISNAIKALEQEAGFPIFVRSNQGVTPTERGRIFLEQAARILESHKNMMEIGKQKISVHFRLGANSYTPLYDAFKDLCKEYSNNCKLSFSIKAVELPEMIDLLYLSQCDLGVMGMEEKVVANIRKTCAEKGIVLEWLYDLPIVFRIGENHPLYRQERVELNMLLEYPFVDYTGHVFSEGILGEYRNMMEQIILVDDRDTRCRLVSEGEMFSVGASLPKYLNERYRFRSIPLEGSSLQLIALSRKDMVKSPENKRYIELLKQRLADIQ